MTQSFALVVLPVNDAPVLAAVSNRTIGAGQMLRVTNTATDVDLPAQTLTFSLLAHPPGAAIGAAIGFAIYRFVGCKTGACPLNSNPWISMLVWGIVGAITTSGR